MKRMQLILAMVFALLCVCFSGSFAFADSENASAANANRRSAGGVASAHTAKKEIPWTIRNQGISRHPKGRPL